MQAEKNAELDRMAAIATDTEFCLRHGMAAWHGSMAWQHGMAADMATDVAINSVGPSSTGKSRPQLKRSRFDPILVCLTFNGYQHFIKLQMSSLYPRDSMFANAHCEASSKVTASNLKAWI